MRNFPADSPCVADIAPSPNHDRRTQQRPDMIVLHYTGMASAEAALARLRDPTAKVSSHYFIHCDGTVVQLVAERRRAWHAGVSSWEGETDVNSRSIGIEIVNPGHDLGYPKFPNRQVDAAIALCVDIARRHRILPHRVLGHSDVAPRRKRDPGEKFPWRRLAGAGVGLWVKTAPLRRNEALACGRRGAAVHELQQALAAFGYGVAVTGRYDRATAAVVTAFQRHFRPRRVDGIADRSTLRTLDALLAKRGLL